jgi:hypothetical protein
MRSNASLAAVVKILLQASVIYKQRRIKLYKMEALFQTFEALLINSISVGRSLIDVIR